MSSISNQQLDFCFLVDVFLLWLFIGSLQVSSPLITKTLFHYYHCYENYQSSFSSCQVQSRHSFIHMNAVGKEKTNPKVFAGDLVRQWHEFSALLPSSVWGGTQNKADSSFSFKPGSLTFVFLSVSVNMVLTQQRGWDVWQWMSTVAHWRTSVSLWEWNSAVTRGFLWSHLQNSSLSVWGPGQAPEVSWDPDSREMSHLKARLTFSLFGKSQSFSSSAGNFDAGLTDWVLMHAVVEESHRQPDQWPV